MTMPATHQRLYINVDHVATLRQARRTDEPDPVAAAALCEEAGAEGITAHLREDRRHMQDDDIIKIASSVRTVFNLEMALTNEMLSIAERLKPYQITIVPERREEVTTEGGLDVSRDPARLRDGLTRLKRAGVRTSLFIDPEAEAVQHSHDLGADAIELHTGTYAHDPSNPRSLRALIDASELGRSLGLAVHAGHGLTVRNVGPVAAIAAIEELNIGHSLVSRAIFVGLGQSIADMREAMVTARHAAR
jgi:pyridoxine 5-phosphate synthase